MPSQKNCLVVDIVYVIANVGTTFSALLLQNS